MSASGYGIGNTLRIHEHVPPEPFTDDYGPSTRPPVDWSRWKGLAGWEINRVDFALANPPLETEPPGKEVERTLTITGTRTIRGRGGAHVVTCFLDDDKSVEYIAKIYDGVDYPLDPDRESYMSLDCMTRADRDYSTEAWAYKMMQPVIGGTIVPTYFGSWTFAVETGRPNQPRWVRMILMELMQGECMRDMISRAEDEDRRSVDYSLLPPEPFRIRVLQNILEAKQTIWWEAAVKHEDLEARNVMVKPDGSVVIIDFNQAYIYEFTAFHDSHPKKRDPTSLPPSPIERCWPLPCGFADSVRDGGAWGHWVPQSWLQNKELAAEWFVETYRGSPKFRPASQAWLNWFWECELKRQKAGSSEKVLRLLESLGAGRPPAGDSSLSSNAGGSLSEGG